MNWRETCAYFEKLVKLDAPPTIKAHCLVRLILPRLAAEIGIEAVSLEMARAFADGLCVASATCVVCKKVQADRGADGRNDDGLCCKCRADLDQLCAEVGL
jgi:hypothetical protein